MTKQPYGRPLRSTSSVRRKRELKKSRDARRETSHGGQHEDGRALARNRGDRSKSRDEGPGKPKAHSESRKSPSKSNTRAQDDRAGRDKIAHPGEASDPNDDDPGQEDSKTAVLAESLRLIADSIEETGTDPDQAAQYIIEVVGKVAEITLKLVDPYKASDWGHPPTIRPSENTPKNASCQSPLQSSRR